MYVAAGDGVTDAKELVAALGIAGDGLGRARDQLFQVHLAQVARFPLELSSTD